MTKTIFATACALALTTSFALAQPSQGQAGANTGPTSNSANSEQSSDMKNGMQQPGMARDGMSRDGMSTSGTNMRDGTNSANPSSQGNVGPGTNNNNSGSGTR